MRTSASLNRPSRTEFRPRVRFHRVAFPTMIALALCVVACGRSDSSSSGAQPARSASAPLQGAGSTFDTPLFSKVFDTLEKQSGVAVNYQSIGSGGGVQQLIKGVVDFGATDF